jgi:hypothetical protein
MTNGARPSSTPEYSLDEFSFDYLYVSNQNNERDTVLVITHKPTGRAAPGISSKKSMGSDFLAAKNEAFERLIQELRTTGVKPEPKREGAKRPGKPRWDQKTEQDEAGNV